MKIQLQANEVVLKATDTLLEKENDETRGKLIITNQRIYFKPLQGDAFSGFELMPGDIRDILFYNILKVIPRGLELITVDGHRHRFAMKNRKEWCRQIAMMG